MNNGILNRKGLGRAFLVALIAVMGSVLVTASPASSQTVISADDCDFIFGEVDALDFQDSATTDGMTGYLTILSQQNSAVQIVSGGDVTICVAGLETGTGLTITLDGATVLYNGPFTANATINGIQWNSDLMTLAAALSNLPCGPHTLTATGTDGEGQSFSQDITFQVTECPELPTTGTDTGRLVGLGGMLVVLGAGLYYGVHQRRSNVVA